LKQVVEAKIAGKEIVAPPAHEQVSVISLMDALKKSVAQAQAESNPAAESKPTEAGRPPKKVAPSTPGQVETKTRKRKSS
jgi:DNA end-binding protein Ku